MRARADVARVRAHRASARARTTTTATTRRPSRARAAAKTSAAATAKVERLDALLSRLGLTSRADAARFIAERVVTTDGARATERATSGKLKARAADVRVDGETLEDVDGLLIVMHKARGVVCSHDVREGTSVYDALPERWRRRKPSIESVGRLDKDTSGLLLLTDDGALVHALTTPKKEIGKWYRVKTDRPIPRDAVEVFASGELTLDGETRACKPAVCELMDDETEARLRLTEGKFHQVKRMFAFFGCTVIGLHRESFGSLTLERAGVSEPGDFKTLPLDFDFSEE